ncbi:MAG: family 16 glycosylhydrolase [Bacteroidales bacterium]|nr:family 16 glycosylhydrolase [Bacteroidales bacterium]
MKKFVYLCGMMLLSMNMMAQIDPYDQNWHLYLNEEFEGNNRSWGRDFVEVNPDTISLWHCFYDDYWPSCITLDKNQHSIFQRTHCLFNDGINFSDGIFRIVAERINPNSIASVGCGDYEFPYPSYHWCDTRHHWLYYYSGAIETIERFHYGYFEIRCKTPVHQGAFPAFWLFGGEFGENSRYEEIDVFEYSWDITMPGTNPSPYYGYRYVFNTGMLFDHDEHGDLREFAHKVVRFPENKPDMNHWHTFGLEWMPHRVVWYFDGEIVNEFNDADNIPYGQMRLIADYVINHWACKDPWDHTSPPVVTEMDTMMIDYIKVYQLNADCEEDLIVSRATQLDSVCSMKRSITIGNPDNAIVAPTTLHRTFRASEIIIDGEFEVPLGSQLAFIAHLCPCQDGYRQGESALKETMYQPKPTTHKNIKP